MSREDRKANVKKCLKITNQIEDLDKSIEYLQKYFRKTLNNICVGTAEEFQYTDKVMKVLEQLEDLRGK